MKRWMIVLIIILVVLIGLFIFRGSEDSWIKNEKGEYVEHGVPSNVPDQIQEQQTAIEQALRLYSQKRAEGMQFSSQCLGVVGDNVKYAVDIVYIPRNEEDDLPENQCEEFRNGNVNYFIELDKEGNIVRVN